MANSDMGVEQAAQQLPKSVVKSHAEAWVDRRGLQPSPDAIIPATCVPWPLSSSA